MIMKTWKHQRIWCSMTRARISTLIRALQLHQLSQTVEPVVMSLSLFETISFMRFEVAKANTSRNQRKSCSKENIVCCFLVLLNWFYYNDSSVNAIVFPFQRVNLSTFFFRVHFCFHLWNIFFTSLNSDFKIRGWCFNFWESAFPYFWESQHVHVWVAWFVLKSKLRDVWNSVDVLVQSKNLAKKM